LIGDLASGRDRLRNVEDLQAQREVVAGQFADRVLADAIENLGQLRLCGKAEEAINFYLSVFKNSKQGIIARYPKGMEPDQEGTLMFSDFILENQWFAAMDSAHEHKFSFNEAISLMVYCDTQEEIDGYWEKLSAVPEAEQCGWLKDRYGVSWQIVPTAMDEMMSQGTPEQMRRVTEAFLAMKKFDLAELQKAYNEE
jgi:predicted 3-demethylubiquinone-9 3-methyltransferase (glyoxalase superfamily)